MKIQLTGIGWYRRGDYEALRAIFTDGHVLPPTFDEWLERAKDVEKQAKRQGMRTVRAYIDPTEFPKWCADRGLNLDKDGRAAFGNTFAHDVLVKEEAAAKESLKAKRKKR
ncbi:MAG: hypothetical protein AABP62_11495 [Planctomycetota bacterium]